MASIVKAIALLVVGGGIGAYAAGCDDPASFETATETRTPTIARTQLRAAAAMSDAAPTPHARVTQYVVVGGHQALAAQGEAEAPDERQRGRRAVVRVAQAGGRMTDMAPPLPIMRAIRVRAGTTDTVAGTQGAEARLAESIQKELKRVGCYAGHVDGDWGPETRRAMRAFNDRVNATLPIEQPDYILLTLLQGHSAKACGAACPIGQDVASNGKCLPRSVIAEERRRETADRAAARASVALATGSTVASDDAAGAKAPASSPWPSRAEIESHRLATVEARRKRAAEEARKQAEAKRAARLAAAETARATAEARRREEIAALAARAADRAAATAERPIPPTRLSSAARVAAAFPPPPLPERPSPTFRQQMGAIRVARAIDGVKAPRARPVASRQHRQRRAREVRFAAQFVPAPSYRVGRLPAAGMRGGGRVFAFAPRPSPRGGYNPQRIFRELQYRMP